MFTQLRDCLYICIEEMGRQELLYVHGNDQKYQLTKFFGWQKKSVKNIPSLKIRKKNKQKYQNHIFFLFLLKIKIFI